jgi:hypothetical protein
LVLLRATPGLEGAPTAIAPAGDVRHRGPIVHQRAGRGDDLAAGTVVDVTCMAIGEVVAREGRVGAGRLAEHCNVRLYPLLVDQLAERFGRAVTAIAERYTRNGYNWVTRFSKIAGDADVEYREITSEGLLRTSSFKGLSKGTRRS